MLSFRLSALVIGLAWLALSGSPARSEEKIVQLSVRPGVTEDLLVTPAPGVPVASVILFSGSPGLLFVRDGAGQIRRLDNGLAELYVKNFLIRTRHSFAAAGFLVISVDAPSDHRAGVDEFRSTAEHAQDISAVIAYARQNAAVPVWLIGTSMGTISAANAAARLKTGGPDGLVLTSSMTTPTKRSQPINVLVDVGAITVPTLFVHNKEDNCVAASFGGVAALMEHFKQTPRKELIVVSGGTAPQVQSCEPMSRHGYLGIEDEVVGDIARWIKAGK